MAGLYEALDCEDDPPSSEYVETCTVHVPVSYAIAHNCHASLEVSTLSELVEGDGERYIKKMVINLEKNIETLSTRAHELMMESHRDYHRQAEAMAAENPLLKADFVEYSSWLKRLLVLVRISRKSETQRLQIFRFDVE